jgi:hypothetical protein
MSKSLKKLNNILTKYRHVLPLDFVAEIEYWKSENIQILQAVYTTDLPYYFKGSKVDLEKVVRRSLKHKVAEELMKYAIIEKTKTHDPGSYGNRQEEYTAKMYVLLDKKDIKDE